MDLSKLIVEKGWQYERAVNLAVELEKMLLRHGIEIGPGSPLEKRIFDVLRIPDIQAAGGAVSFDEDVRGLFRNLTGVNELAQLILAAESNAEFPTLMPHLKLLNDGSAIQNEVSHGLDGATNKLFELLIALLAMHCGTHVELDDPLHSTGKNPDVLVTAVGKRWGIACKVLHGSNPEGFLEHLSKGIEQIEKSEAEVGVVAFNTKNLIPHDDLWPLGPEMVETSTGLQEMLIPQAFDPPGVPFEMLAEWAHGFAFGIRQHVPAGHLEGMFAGKKCIPGLLFWCHTVSGVVIDSRPTAASLRMMTFFNLGVVHPADRSFLECLNWAAFSDSPSRGPRPQVLSLGSPA